MNKVNFRVRELVMEIPIQTVHLFPKLDEKLLTLLRSFQPDDWAKPTLAKRWTVKDVATHLLDGNIRMLSMARIRSAGTAK